MGKALVLIVVALGAGLLVYWLASGRIASRVGPVRQPDSTSASGSLSPGNSAPVPRTDSGPIAPPKTPQEQERETLASRRSPLYARLRQDLGASLVAVRPSDDDAATLDLYAAQDAPGNATAMLNIALRDNVAYYGFRHIEYFAPNPPGAIEKFRLDTEANSDSSGNWQVFKK